MPNHWHLVLRPQKDGQMERMLRWVTATHSLRYHAYYHTRGEGHNYQARFKSFPVQNDSHFYVLCRYVERNPMRTNLVRRAEDWIIRVALAMASGNGTSSENPISMAHPTHSKVD